jgi:hypothetical protein
VFEYEKMFKNGNRTHDMLEVVNLEQNHCFKNLALNIWEKNFESKPDPCSRMGIDPKKV